MSQNMVWTDTATTYFFQFYRVAKEKFLPSRSNQIDKWMYMSKMLQTVGYNVTPRQVQNRMKTLFRAYRRYLEIDSKGKSRDVITFEEDIKEAYIDAYAFKPEGSTPSLVGITDVEFVHAEDDNSVVDDEAFYDSIIEESRADDCFPVDFRTEVFEAEVCEPKEAEAEVDETEVDETEEEETEVGEVEETEVGEAEDDNEAEEMSEDMSELIEVTEVVPPQPSRLFNGIESVGTSVKRLTIRIDRDVKAKRELLRQIEAYRKESRELLDEAKNMRKRKTELMKEFAKRIKEERL